MSTDFKSIQTCETLGQAEEELRYKLEVIEGTDDDGKPIQAIGFIVEHQVSIPIPIPGVDALAVRQSRLVTVMTLQAAQEMVDGLTAYLESFKLPDDCPVDL